MTGATTCGAFRYAAGAEWEFNRSVKVLFSTRSASRCNFTSSSSERPFFCARAESCGAEQNHMSADEIPDRRGFDGRWVTRFALCGGTE